MDSYYLLTERIVDPQSGEVLGKPGEQNPQRVMDYLSGFASSMEWPKWLQHGLNACYQGNGPFPQETCDRFKKEEV